jgi:hypothetical protein
MERFGHLHLLRAVEGLCSRPTTNSSSCSCSCQPGMCSLPDEVSLKLSQRSEDVEDELATAGYVSICASMLDRFHQLPRT